MNTADLSLAVSPRPDLPRSDSAHSGSTARDSSVIDMAVEDLRGLNQRLQRALPGADNSRWRVLNPRGAHAIAVGLSQPLEVAIEGHMSHWHRQSWLVAIADDEQGRGPVEQCEQRRHRRARRGDYQVGLGSPEPLSCSRLVRPPRDVDVGNRRERGVYLGRNRRARADDGHRAGVDAPNSRRRCARLEVAQPR